MKEVTELMESAKQGWLPRVDETSTLGRRGLGEIPTPKTYYKSDEDDIRVTLEIDGVKYGARIPDDAPTEAIVDMLRRTLLAVRDEEMYLPLMGFDS